MEEIDLPHRGWGKGSVRVDHAPADAATVMEIQGNWLSSYYVYGLVDTPDRLERGRMLCTQNHGRQRLRAVVPRDYTHVTMIGSQRSSGPIRWKVGFRPGDTCAELRGTVRGRHPDVLRYEGPATKAASTRSAADRSAAGSTYPPARS
jgi:hypothetical protein